MRTTRLCVGLAALGLVATVVIGVRRGDSREPPPPAAARVPAVSAVSAVLPVGTVPPRPSPPASATAPSSSLEDEAAIPTELPESPGLDKELSRDGTVRDHRVVYTYQLGLMAFYQRCMKGHDIHGVIYYFIHWQVDEHQVASSPMVTRAGVPPEGDANEDDEAALVACVKQYVASHDRVVLPHGGRDGESWGMRAVFPVRDSVLLKLIAEAKTEAEPASRASPR